MLVAFKSPLHKEGKKSLMEYCQKNNLNFDDEFKKLSFWFASFGMIHPQAQEQMRYNSWLAWLLLCPELPQEIA